MPNTIHLPIPANKRNDLSGYLGIKASHHHVNHNLGDSRNRHHHTPSPLSRTQPYFRAKSIQINSNLCQLHIKRTLFLLMCSAARAPRRIWRGRLERREEVPIRAAGAVHGDWDGTCTHAAGRKTSVLTSWPEAYGGRASTAGCMVGNEIRARRRERRRRRRRRCKGSRGSRTWGRGRGCTMFWRGKVSIEQCNLLAVKMMEWTEMEWDKN